MKAIDARIQGDDYQARVFWLHACRLFEQHSKVSRVGYDVDDVKYFDDVVVHYHAPLPDGVGGSIQADYYQVKYHVDHSGEFTWQALMDPRFIGASTSVLQRLADLAGSHPSAGHCRFYLVSPWRINPQDGLAKLVSTNDGEMRMDLLLGKTMGKIRKAWSNHLGLSEPQDLRKILAPLRIYPGSDYFKAIAERVNDKLLHAGLAPVDGSSVAFPYDDLIAKLHSQGWRYFTRADIEAICRNEGLWRGTPEPTAADACEIGIRSFIRRAEYMEDETDHMLCLLKYFDNRDIRRPELWAEAVLPDVERFLRQHATGARPCHLHVDAHSSVAFAAGYCLDPKSGVDVAVVQKGRTGKALWRVSATPRQADGDMWHFDEIRINDSGGDVAVAVSVTHDVLPDVKEYVRASLPSVGRILRFSVLPASGPTAVRDGEHAGLLSQALASAMKTVRTAAERRGRLHVFMAAPNGFAFFLGQLARGFGPCTIYEYEFEAGTPGGYKPSLSFPPSKQDRTKFAKGGT